MRLFVYIFATMENLSLTKNNNFMKKFLLLLTTLCLSTMPCIKSMAYDFAVNNDEDVIIYYNIATGYSANSVNVTYAGTSYSNVKNSYTGDVVIPGTVKFNGEEYTVRGVVQNCFRGCTGLTSIVLPNTITSMSGTYAFRDCTALVTATLPNESQSIPDYTFYGCTALTKVTYNDAEDNDECVQLPATVNAINPYSFYGCTSLTGNLTLPGTMNYIAQYAFVGCTGLTSVTVEYAEGPLYVENSTSSSSSNCFNKCSNVTMVYLNRDTENVYSINNSTSHDYGLFRNISSDNLTTIYIGKDVKEIGPATFYGNKAVKNVIFEEDSQLETIGSRAFYQCVGYGSGNSTAVVEGSTVYLPDAVKEIGQYAFYQDYGLEGVVISENSQLETIDGYSFGYCKYITEFTIPHKVTSIGTNVWVSCSSLKKIHLLNPEPISVVSNDFSSDGDMDWPLVIYVPSGSEEAYEASTWYTNVVGYNTYQGKIIFNSSVVTIDALDASGEEDYASYYHPYALTIPDGVKAYAITSFSSDGTLTMTEITDGVIPQHSAVLLERAASSGTSSYRIYIAEDDTHTAISGNLLYGSEQSTTTSVDGVTEGYYFYGLTTKNGENLGFYWGAENGVAFTMPANKAWLALPSAEVANISYLKLKKDGNTTGIESVEAAEETNDGAIYTLQGVRVSDMSQKGIYIVNGKKVLVK